MKNLISALIVLVIAVGAARADQNAPAATQPAAPQQKPASFVIHFEELELPPGIDPKQRLSHPPAGSKSLATIETVATEAVPYRSLTTIGARTLEVDGMVTDLRDGNYRVKLKFTDREPTPMRVGLTTLPTNPDQPVISTHSVTTTLEFKPDQPPLIVAGFVDRIVTLTLVTPK